VGVRKNHDGLLHHLTLLVSAAVVVLFALASLAAPNGHADDLDIAEAERAASISPAPTTARFAADVERDTEANASPAPSATEPLPARGGILVGAVIGRTGTGTFELTPETRGTALTPSAAVQGSFGS
jgi:hypothetical protein